MLGKTAGGLFWMYRYLERAENTARLIEAGQRIALTRLEAGDANGHPSCNRPGQKAPSTANTTRSRATPRWTGCCASKANPSSVLSCIESARQNARLVRTALTGEVWGATNAAYMRIREKLARKVSERDLPEVLRDIRQHTSLVRGMTHGTMLRNEIYDFVRLGTFWNAPTTPRAFWT